METSLPFFPTYHQTKTTKIINKKKTHNKVKVCKLGEYPSFLGNFREMMKTLGFVSECLWKNAQGNRKYLCCCICIYGTSDDVIWSNVLLPSLWHQLINMKSISMIFLFYEIWLASFLIGGWFFECNEKHKEINI